MKQIIPSNINILSGKCFCLLLLALLVNSFALATTTNNGQESLTLQVNLDAHIEATDVLCHGDENGTLTAEASGEQLHILTFGTQEQPARTFLEWRPAFIW